MARVLILGGKKSERHCLALFLEFVGHFCWEADSLSRALEILSQEDCELVLADPRSGAQSAAEILRTLNQAAPDCSILILSEEGAPAGAEKVITGPPMIHNGSVVRKGEAFLLLLPEREALKMLSDLPQTAGLLNKLALLYQRQEKYAAAEQLYRQALKLSEAAAPGNSEPATILMNLGSLYDDQSKYAEAENLYLQSLAAAERVHGPEHAKVGRRLRRLLELYRVQGRSREAAPLYERLRRMNDPFPS